MTPKQKAKILREIYGSLMTLEDVRRELGCTKRWAKQWLENHQIFGIRMSEKRVKYDADMVASAIVRDMGVSA